jgi:uncharacterized membrane protein
VELHGLLISDTLLWVIYILYGAILVAAIRMAPWRTLLDSERRNTFLGTCVVLILLWHVRGAALDELSFHFLGVTTVTLMFGWSLAIIATSIAMIGITLNGSSEWAIFAINELVVGIIPVTITQISLILVRSYLPKNFFIYVLGNGFLTAGLAATIAGYTAAWILTSSGTLSYATLSSTILPFFPLIFFPEAFINGWAITILVCYRPHWVYSFSDDLYIRGK